MRSLLLSSILLVGLLAGCTSDRPRPLIPIESVSSTTSQAPTPADFPLALNITGDVGLRLATRGPEGCLVHVAAAFRPNGTAPWMMVLEEESGARFLYGHAGPSVHALQADTFQEGDGSLQAWNVSVGTWKKDSVTVALKNLEWVSNEFTRDATLKVWTDCRVESVHRFSFVRLADDYSFRGGAGSNSMAANTNLNDHWSVTVPGNATLVGRQGQTVFKMDWATPAGPMVWDQRLFVSYGPPGQYDATLTSTGDNLLMLAVLAP